MAKTEKNSFLLYDDTGKLVELLSDEQAGKLLKAVFCYRSGAPMPELDGMTNIAFITIQNYLDRDAEKYAETCRRRSENGKKGGRPKKPNGFEEKAKKPNGFSENQTKAKKADSDNDNDSDSDNDSDMQSNRGRKPRFIPPTLEEVAQYCRERNNGIDAQHFIDYYAMRGWELNKGRKMKDWKAAIRTWENNGKKWEGGKAGNEYQSQDIYNRQREQYTDDL